MQVSASIQDVDRAMSLKHSDPSVKIFFGKSMIKKHSFILYTEII